MTDRKIAEVFPPGEFIREELEARNWSQVELAEIIGRQPKVVHDIIAGKRSITPEIAKALGDAFGTSAQYWMNLESEYLLWRTKDADNVIVRRAKLYQLAPIKEMTKRHWIEPSESIDVLEKRVTQFFHINNLDEPITFAHAARKSTSEINNSHNAWLFRAKELAPAIHVKSFSTTSLKNGLEQLKNVLHSTQEVRHIPRILAEAGIRFLIVEHLPQTKIDGVVFWLDAKSPVIVLSLRYDRIDYFWFTLIHEIDHVQHNEGQSDPIIDIELVGENIHLGQQSKSEERANSFASNFLVKRSELDNFMLRVKPLYSRQRISNFANRIGVHPGIVVGQLHALGLPYSSFRPMLEKVKNIIIQSALTDGWGQTPIYRKEI
jgi:HTH-type transcriptional regulator/antitoxin HigA